MFLQEKAFLPTGEAPSPYREGRLSLPETFHFPTGEVSLSYRRDFTSLPEQNSFPVPVHGDLQTNNKTKEKQ